MATGRHANVEGLGLEKAGVQMSGNRIAVDARRRSIGIGQALYAGAISRAREGGRPVFCAEVTTVPANEPSLRFHAQLRFEEVARKRPYGVIFGCLENVLLAVCPGGKRP